MFSYRLSFSCGSNPKCFTYVPIDWASTGARILPRRLQEAPGGPRRHQEATGSARRHQTKSRRHQEVPRGSRKLQEAQDRLQSYVFYVCSYRAGVFYVCSYILSFSCGSNPRCVTYVSIDWASCGARVLGVLRMFLQIVPLLLY